MASKTYPSSPTWTAPVDDEMNSYTAVRRLGKAVLQLLKRQYFADRFPPEAQAYMARLLLSIDDAAQSGSPLSKKDAAEVTGAADIKTGRKYIALAEQHGLIEVQRSAADKRKELLYPTDILREMLRKETKVILEEILAPILAEKAASNSAKPLAPHEGQGQQRGKSLSGDVLPLFPQEEPLEDFCLFDRKRLSAREAEARELLEKGRQASRQGKTEEAIVNFTQALRVSPSTRAGYLLRAQALRPLSPTMAIEDLNAAIRLARKEPAGYYLRGRAYYFRADLLNPKGANTEDVTSAINDFNDAQRLGDQHQDIHVFLGNLFDHRGELKRALAEYTEALKQDPSDIHALFRRSRVHRQLGDAESAKSDYTAFQNAVRGRAPD